MVFVGVTSLEDLELVAVQEYGETCFDWLPLVVEQPFSWRERDLEIELAGLFLKIHQNHKEIALPVLEDLVLGRVHAMGMYFQSFGGAHSAGEELLVAGNQPRDFSDGEEGSAVQRGIVVDKASTRGVAAASQEGCGLECLWLLILQLHFLFQPVAL